MKILHTSHLYSPSVGGNQIHIKELSEHLVGLGHDVHVFTSNVLTGKQFFGVDKTLDLPKKREEVNGVKIRRFSINYFLYSFFYRKILKLRGGYRLLRFMFRKGLYFFEHGPFIPRMLFDIYRLKPDLMMAINDYSALTYLCYLAKKMFGIPFVITPTTHTFEEWSKNQDFLDVVGAADLVIVLTEFEKDFFIQKGIAPLKIKVIGVGINLDQKLIGSLSVGRKKMSINDEPAVLFLGRRVVLKGVNDIIDAMEILWKKRPTAKLLIAGSKKESDVGVVQKIASISSKYKKNVIELDGSLEEDKADIYAACDVFVMPSRIDSFGIVYLEAWANNKPVIACRDTPQESLIDDGVDGVLVDWNNPEELASALEKVLLVKEESRLMGERGYQKVVDHFTWKKIAENIQKEYLSLVK